MNEEIMQEQDITPEEAKASLGLSTRLSEQFLMSQVPQDEPEAPIEAQEAPQQEKTIRDEYPEEEASNEKLDMVLDEIASIKEEIKEALEGDKDVDNGDKENGEQE